MLHELFLDYWLWFLVPLGVLIIFQGLVLMFVRPGYLIFRICEVLQIIELILLIGFVAVLKFME